MRLKMLVCLGGLDFNLEPGDTHEFEETQAIRLIEAGYAQPVETTEIETTAVAPRGERRKRG